MNKRNQSLKNLDGYEEIMQQLFFTILVTLCQNFIDENEYKVLGEQVKLSPGVWEIDSDGVLTNIA